MHGRRSFFGILILIILIALPSLVHAQDTLRLEAEDYASMSGIQTEPTTDVGGGLNVGWIDSGDWLSYSFNLSDSGLYTIRYRVASESNGGHFQLVHAENDIVFDEMEFNATGGWQNWVTVESQAQLSAGAHNIILKALKSDWNINWIEVELSSETSLAGFSAHCVSEVPHPSGPFKIEAENFVRMHGIQTETTTDIGGGLNVGWIEPQDTMTYAVELSQAGLYKFSYRVASMERGGSFQLESPSGTEIYDHVEFEATGGWQNWTTVESLVVLPAGAQEITIRALSEGWNLNWIELELEAPGPLGVRVEAEDYIAMSGVQTEATTDFGGGLNVGYIDATDWMSYIVDIPESGQYNIRYRVASLQHGGDFRLVSADGSVIFDEVTFAATGGWQNWLTVESQVELLAGEQTITINSLNSGWNINWLEIDATPINNIECDTFRVQAQHYAVMDGVNNELTLDENGGLNVGGVDAGDWMAYDHFQSPGLYTARYRVASPEQGVSFQIENSNGQVLDTVQFDATGGWQDWITVEPSSQFTLDENQIIIRSLNGAWNFNWFDLVAVSGDSQSSSSASSGFSSSSSSLSSVVSSSSLSSASSASAFSSFSSSSASSVSTVSSSPVNSSSSVSSVPSYTATIQAENYVAMQGIQTEPTTDTGGGLNVGWIDSGDWMAYDINLPQAGLYRIRYRVASLENGGNFLLEAASDETVYDTVAFDATGGWQTWITVEAMVQLPAGHQQVTITSQNSGWNINWFELEFISAVSSSSSLSSASSSLSSLSSSASSGSSGESSSVSSAHSSMPMSSSSSLSSSSSSSDWGSGSSSSDSSTSSSESPIEYLVSTQVDGLGTVSPSEDVVQSGESALFTVVASDGYEIDTVTGCDGILDQNNYSISNVSSDCTIEAIFKLQSSQPGDVIDGRYIVDETDGSVVTDLETGLEWKRCTEPSEWNGSGCVQQDGSFDLYVGYRHIDVQNLTLEDGWRIPSREELESIVYCSEGIIDDVSNGTTRCDYGSQSPTINLAAFPGGQPASTYWSSTPRVQLDDSFWGVSFSSGWTRSLSLATYNFQGNVTFYTTAHLRLVRGDMESQYELSIGKEGAGTGTVTVVNDNVDCEDECHLDLSAGTEVELRATPDPGMVFARWSGACRNTDDVCIVSLDKNQQVRAHFLVDRYEYPASGVVLDNETGLEWQRCTYGQIWTGVNCEGSAEMLRRDDVGGRFFHGGWRLPARNELTSIVYCNSGSPSFEGDNQSPCRNNYTSPTIAAWAFPNTESTNYWSSSWYSQFPVVTSFGNGGSGYISSFSTLAFRLVRDPVPPQSVQVNINVTGAGEGSIITGNITCDGACVADYSNVSSIVFEAIPEQGSKFYGWRGLCTGDESWCEVTNWHEVDEVEAIFIQDRYEIRGPEGGVIYDSITGLEWQRCSIGQSWDGTACVGTAASRSWSNAMAQASPSEGWRLPEIEELATLVYCSSGEPDYWNETGDRCTGDFLVPTILQQIFSNTNNRSYWSSSPGTGNAMRIVDFGNGRHGSLSLTNAMGGSTTANARLVRNAHAQSYALTVNNVGTGFGTVSSNPAGIDCGTACVTSFPSEQPLTLTATPASGFVFAGWGGGCSGRDLECTISMTQDYEVWAEFTDLLALIDAIPPAFVLGSDITLEGGNSSSVEGEIVAYRWIRLSDGELVGEDANLVLTGLVVGHHQYRLEVEDNHEQTATTDVAFDVGYQPVAVAPAHVAGYIGTDIVVNGQDSYIEQGTLTYYWYLDGQLLSDNNAWLTLNLPEAGSYALNFFVTSELGLSDGLTIQVDVLSDVQDLMACPYVPRNSDEHYIAQYPDNNIPWQGGRAHTVADIARAFNFARLYDPSVHHYLIMPEQGVWDAMNLPQKGLYLINAERVARGIKPYAGYDEAMNEVAQTYAEYIHSRNEVIGHFNDGRSPMQRMRDNAYIDAHADAHILKTESMASIRLNEQDSEAYALVKAIYAWIYEDKDWFADFGLADGDEWGHRDHLLQTNLQDNHGSPYAEGVVGFGLARGPYQPGVSSPVLPGAVVAFKTIDQGPSWDEQRIGTVDVSQAQGCIPYAINIPEDEPDVMGLESIRIAPENIHLAVGQQQGVSIVGVYIDGSEVNLNHYGQLTTTDQSVVSVDQGVITAVRPGPAKVYARVGSVESNRLYVTVGQPLNIADFDGTDAQAVAPYLADNATRPQPLNAGDDRVADYDAKAMSVFTGIVTDRYGVPMSGVTVSFLKARNYGSVQTNNDGRFILAGPAGKQTVVYEKPNHLVVQRTTTAASSQWATFETVILLPRDTKTTRIDLSSGTPQVHQSSTIVDEFGERKATVVFNNVNSAEIQSWDGSVRPISNFDLSVTEFEIPESMPGELPAETAFTWASDFHVEGAHFSDRIVFDQPVYVFVDNFLNFDVGEVVPVGFFNRRTSLWEASENGVVVRVVDSNNDGFPDGLDYTGDGLANDLSGNGSAEGEIAGLEGYSIGDTLWWGRVNQFSVWDYNWAAQDAESPDGVETEEVEEQDCDNNGKGAAKANTGSEIDAYQQTFHEEIQIAGTNVTLNYSSRRTAGYHHKVRVRVSGEEISPSLENMIARLEIAGHVFEQEFYPEPDVVAEFVWDGTHPDGSRAQGLVSGRVSIGYEYQTLYLSSGNASEEGMPPSSFPIAWATLSDVTTQVPGRDSFIAWQQKGITIKNTFDTQLAEGWSLSAVHEIDPSGKVYLGTGKAFDVATPSLILKTGLTFSHVHGDDGYYQKGGRDIDYTITDRNTLVDRVTGLEWQYTQQPFRTVNRAEAAAYCANEAEPRDRVWRLPTEKEAGYTMDKSGGSAGQMIYSMTLASGLWRQNTVNVNNALLGAVCVSGPILGQDIDEQLERNNTDEVVIDKENGLMWQDTQDNQTLTLDWEASINYCEDSLHAGYDDWRLPNINELLYVLPNQTFSYQTTLPPDFGLWDHNNPHRNPYWSSTTNIQNDALAWVSESNSFNSHYFTKEDAYHVRCVRDDSTASRMPLRFNGQNQHVASFDMLSGTEYQFIDYNAEGQVTGIEDQFGNRLTIERDSLGTPYRLVAPNGQVTELTINSANHLTQIRYEDASRFDFSYSEGGLLTEKVDPRGASYTRQYNTIGRVEQATDPAGGFWQTFNSKLGLNESLYGYTTGEGNSHQVERRVLPNGDVISTTTTLRGAERVSVTSEDELTESITAYGMSQVINKVLDEKTLRPVPHEITVTTPSGLTRSATITKAFAQNGADTSAYTLTVDANGDISTTSVNGRDGTWVHTSAEGRIATILSDPNTLLTERIQVPGLHDSHSVYDDRGRVIESHTGSRVTTYSYNTRGLLSAVTASDNRVTEFEYDLLGRTTRIHYPDGFSTAFEYDANGNATKVTVPTQEAHDFTFTAINQVDTETQPPATTTAYVYNSERALTEIQLPSGDSIHYNYQSGRLQQMQTPEGITEYRYQQGDQLHEVETGAELARYHYDGTLFTGLEYEGELNTSLGYGYDNHFRVNQVSYAGSSTAIGYDKDGLMTAIHGYSLDYHPQNGLPEQIENGSWRKQWSWTPYGEVSAVSHQLGAQESYGYALEYNQVGQISRKIERSHNGTLVTYDYTYDNRYRLIEVRENGQITEAYSYDANGNRVSRTSVHRNIVSQSATYALGDQLHSQGNTVYSYDANGRLSSQSTVEDGETQLTTYVYSSLGQLLQVDTPEQSIEYHHNALGQRVAKLVNGQVTEKYLWRDLITLLAIYDASGNVKQRFEHTLGHTPTSFTQNGQRYFIQSDHLGSPRVITDSSGTVVKTIDYDSYGNIIHDSNESFDIPFGFAGGLHDRDTGLIRFGYRDYDPNIGRWTARDPIGFAGGDTNLYGYVLGDPVNFYDLLGLEVTLNCRPLGGALGYLGLKHCSVFVWHWEVDECGNKIKVIDKQFSLSYGNSTFHGTDPKTFDADTKAFLEGNGNYDIPLPVPYTQEGFDQRVIAEGESFSQGRYDPIDGPNSNTAANNIISNAGGDVPFVRGAPGQNYTPGGSPPMPNYWYGR